MQTDNFFNLVRFGVLCRQNVMHHYKLALAAIVAYCGGLFMLLLLIQFMGGFHRVAQDRFLTVFVITFGVSGIICAGTAFPNFRSREKMHSYLMIPASAFEKFLMEVVGRILLFIMIVPLLYWGVYNVEGYFVSLFYAPFDFQGSIVFPDFFSSPSETYSNRMRIFSFTGGLLIFVTAFTGATIFVKNPVVKSLFSVAVILFFNLALAYFFLRGLDFSEYHVDGALLGMRHQEDFALGMIIATLVFNVGFLATAYFKVKEREV